MSLLRPGMNPTVHAMIPLLKLFFGSAAILLLLLFAVGCATHPPLEPEVQTPHLQVSLLVCDKVADGFSNRGFDLSEHHRFFGLCMAEQGYARIQGRYILTPDGRIAVELRVADYRLKISTVMGEQGHGRGSKARRE